jgi:hypothetical protein
MAKYRKKKPVVIQAAEWTGSNKAEVENFMGKNLSTLKGNNNIILISTIGGVMQAQPGDFIICGVNGEFYPCKPDIFHKTYDQVE